MQVPLKRPAAVLMLSLQFMLATGCAERSPVANEAIGRVSGETLYRGIFFGEGEIARSLPEVWKGRYAEDRATTLNAERLATLERFQEAVIRDIQAKDPTFFTKFAARVQSGDHVEVERALDAGASLMQTALEANEEYRAQRALGEDVIMEGGWFYVETVVAVFFVAIATLFLTQFDATPDLSPAHGNTILDRDRLVDLVATRLRA